MLEASYILHRRQYRETSLLLDVFTYKHGVVSLIAKGAYKAKSQNSAQLQAFRPLLLDWVGRGELKTLTKAESPSLPLSFPGKNVYSAMYINELLHKLLIDTQPSPDLFESYVVTMGSLTRASVSLGVVLRNFEASLLKSLGLMPALSVDWLGEPISPLKSYYLSEESTLVPISNDQTSEAISSCQHPSVLEGSVLVTLADTGVIGEGLMASSGTSQNSTHEKKHHYEKDVNGQRQNDEQLHLESRSARYLMRFLIDRALNGAKLHSREMMRQVLKSTR